MKLIPPHPNIVKPVEFIEGQCWTHLIMELAQGQQLQDYFKVLRDEIERKRIIKDVLKALSHMHQNSIWHRDVKPENVVVTPDTVKLVDFNVSKKLVKGQATLLTEVGTKLFNAPEIIQQKDVDERSDVWGVGCLLCLMLTGKIPFNGFSNQMSLKDLNLH